MSLEHDTTDPQVDPQADPQATPATAPSIDPAKFVSRDDYEKLQAQLAHMGETVSYLRGQAEAAGRQLAPAPAAEPQLTEDQLAEMLESGDGRQILKAQQYITQRALAPVAAANEQRYQQIVALGTTLTQRQVKSAIPLYDTDPAIKRDVDALLNTLPAEARANPEAWELVYRQVTGSPQHLERIISQRVEEELRRRNDATVGDPSQQPSSRTQPAKGGVSTLESVFGESVSRSLQNAGYNQDTAAQALGYPDWKTYLEKTSDVPEWPS